MRSVSSRRGLLFLLLVVAGLVVGCSAPPDPEVTFYAAGKASRVGPAQYCDAQIENCAAHPQNAAVLRLPPGRPLQISVPAEVANAPWQIAFRYRDTAGHEQEGRTGVFPPNSPRYAYTLRLPDPAAQLETAEVQQFGVVLLAPQGADPASGGFQFVVRATWVLSVDDRPQH